MTIVPMTKVTLCGMASEMHDVVARLQDMGCLHVVPIGAPSGEGGATGGYAKEVHEALTYLVQTPHIRRSLRADPTFDIHLVARRALEIKQRQRELTDRIAYLQDRIANLRRWGHFTFPDPDALAGYRLWFYEVPLRQRHAMAHVDLPWAEVGRSHRTCFIVVVATTEPPPDAMPVARTHTGGQSLATLEAALEDAEIAQEDLQLERIGLTRYIHLIRRNLARADDTAAFHDALDAARTEDGVFAVQGWAPEPSLDDVTAFADDRGLALVTEPPGEAETPPTLLDNAMPAEAGEDLTRFYQMPAPRDWDPSGVLVGSFALFFAMILSDAAYGALVLGATALFWPRMGRSAAGQRLRVLMGIMGGTAVAYGVAAGSYFGVRPPADTLLGAVAVIDVRDYWDMMALSVAIGVGHVTLANAAHARRAWPRIHAVAHLGWIAVAIGGFVAWRGHTAGAALVFDAGLAAVIAGLAAVLLCRSDRPVRRPLDVVLRMAEGLLGVSQVTQMFGDVLSYLRLFALGLASASLAVTFNDLSLQAANSVEGLGVLLAILIALIGHTMNFALAIIGGVVHGLRLNFIEFYKWGFGTEGYPFRPLARKELRV
jgi:V/A-type H+-transporting ATPase subunit I